MQNQLAAVAHRFLLNILDYTIQINQLDPLMQGFWYIAIPSSIIFLLQSSITLLTASFSSDSDFEFHNELFSLRSLINFLLGVGWTGISLNGSIKNQMLTIGIALFVGFLFVYLFIFVIAQIQKLAEDNSFKIKDTLNQMVEVYLSIPAHKTGKGKVMISINGSFHELEAITEFEKIPTHAMAKVVGIENDSILIVISTSPTP